ncbi:MAG: PBP1A family penicillin-binding protein [Thermoanaerobaculia bacterium]
MKKSPAQRSLGQTLTMALRQRDGLLVKVFVGAGLLLLASALWYIWPYWQLSGHFATLPTVQPSRLYAQPFRLFPGERLTPEALVARLVELHYLPADEGELEPGRFRSTPLQVGVFRRHFPSATADTGGDLLVVDFVDGRITALMRAEHPVREAWIDPPLLASYYGDTLLERRPTPLADIAPSTVRAVLAAEDSSFFEHPGISFTGILRAVWVNLRGSGVMQGGSTLTQQLVKNIYLTSERTMSRKLREALLAVMLEWRYSKEQILEAYLNQIFWGRSGSANLIGIGAASAAYCGKEPRELTLAESALLAAMIRAPGSYHPVEDAAAARERRDFILERLVALRWADRAAADAAKKEPLPVPIPALSRRQAPYFADAVVTEARRRFGVSELADGGFTLLSTLNLDDQKSAEKAVLEGLAELADKSERVRNKTTPLQSALVSLDTASGAIRAWVGGREYHQSQFDRAGSARRQAGSAFKPLVYATAFEQGVATPATLIEDSPLTLESGGKSWSPMNDDDQFHGWVTARTAVEQSYNLPTIRLALATGLPKIVQMARDLGIAAGLKPVPSIAIGSFEVAPVELAVAYAAFARGGVRPTARMLDAVLSPGGAPLASREEPAPRQVMSPQTAFLVTSLLQGVVDYGTARSMRTLGLKDPVAGKTGTSNSRRDNWFVGFTPDRATVVWVGFDDDSPTPFSGSKAALPVWTKFMVAVRPADGYPRFATPSGIRVVLIDPATGELATDRCPEVLSEAFPVGREPLVVCHLHGGRGTLPIDPQMRAEIQEERSQSGISGWLKRVFSRKPRSSGPSP